MKRSSRVPASFSLARVSRKLRGSGENLVSRLGLCVSVIALLAAALSATIVGVRPAIAQQTQAVSPELEAEYDAAFQDMLQKPSDLDVLFKFATIASKTGDLEGAISALEAALAREGGNAHNHDDYAVEGHANDAEKQHVGLHQRAAPLLHMLKDSLADKKDVTWKT
eukprot:gene45846-61278_t